MPAIVKVKVVDLATAQQANATSNENLGSWEG